MKNFQPGGLRNRKPDLGGRPFSDAGNYAPKKRFDGKPAFNNKPSFGDRDKKDVTLYAATCTTCGKSCEVPFRPDGKKPVLCRDCFSLKNESPVGGQRDRFTPNEFPARNFEPQVTARPVASPELRNLVNHVSALEEKVNQILELLKTAPAKTDKVIAVTAETVVEADEATTTKVRKPKKVTPAIKKAAVKKKVAKKAAVAKKAGKKTK
jgi:CxxC-x17-CxxC domain-containing protein